MSTDLDDDGITIIANLGEMFNNYEGLSYQLHDALAEFIDNSVDSYLKNKQELKDAGRDEFEIEIILNNAKDSLTINDFAFGMDKDELKQALIPDKKNPDPNHLGMYGRGLKTAAGWFGKYWVVETKKLGSDVEYTATVDILKLLGSEENDGEKNFIPITAKSVPGKPNQSYTKVVVTKGIRKYYPATQTKAKRSLAIKYQRLIENEISLKWRSSTKKETLTFTEPDIFSVKNPEYDAEEATCNPEYDEPEMITYDFPCEFDILDDDGNVKASLSGRYGIYPPQGTQVPFAGLTMFWKNRVIVDRNRNYWPEVFGAGPGDLKRQRLFVHLDTDLNPTSDKKDFKWDSYSFDELDAALTALHGGNLVKVSEIGKNLSTKEEKQLTEAQIQAELLRLKELLESQATTDALLSAHPILKAGVGELTEEEEQILDDEESPEINIQINQGTPTLAIKNSRAMHAKDNFCKIKLDPDNLTIKVYINQKHSFYVAFCAPSAEAHALYLKMISCLALARWSANTSTGDIPIDSYLKLLNEHLTATASDSETY